jgi:hypothetical protein
MGWFAGSLGIQFAALLGVFEEPGGVTEALADFKSAPGTAERHMPAIPTDPFRKLRRPSAIFSERSD